MKVLVCGSRQWEDREYIESVMKRLKNEGMDYVITGGASGADQIANDIAEEMGIAAHIVSAKWNKYGKAAGPIRNAEMLKLDPDLVVAFFTGTARGTKNMVEQAIAAGVKIKTYYKEKKV